MKIQQEVRRAGGMEAAGHPVHNPQVKQAAVTVNQNLPRQLYRECHPVLCYSPLYKTSWNPLTQMWALPFPYSTADTFTVNPITAMMPPENEK